MSAQRDAGEVARENARLRSIMADISSAASAAIGDPIPTENARLRTLLAEAAEELQTALSRGGRELRGEILSELGAPEPRYVTKPTGFGDAVWDQKRAAFIAPHECAERLNDAIPVTPSRLKDAGPNAAPGD